MILSFSHKFIFFHIPKTAGTSVSFALSKYENKIPYSLKSKFKRTLAKNRYSKQLVNFHFKDFHFKAYPHLSALDASNMIPDYIYQDMFKFAFVRHPVDWQFAVYRHILSKYKDNPKQFAPVFKLKSFDEYIHWRIGAGSTIPQVLQILDSRGNIAVDKVGRFENLENDFNSICETIGINEKLPRLNVGKHSHCDISSKTRDLIYEYYYPDFEAFGYQIGTNEIKKTNFEKYQYSSLINQYINANAMSNSKNIEKNESYYDAWGIYNMNSAI